MTAAKLRDNNNTAEHWKKLGDYLFYFVRQRDLGLLIVRDEVMREAKKRISQTFQIVSVETSQELACALEYQLSVFIELTPELPSTLLRDIKQCAVRSGALQVVHQESGDVQTLEYDPMKSHILLMVTTENLQAVCERFSIQHYVGFIEHI